MPVELEGHVTDAAYPICQHLLVKKRVKIWEGTMTPKKTEVDPPYDGFGKRGDDHTSAWSRRL